jgi:O-antigen/teichoic acid export membrane protein
MGKGENMFKGIVILCFILIPFYKMEGAALSTSLAVFLGVLIGGIYVYRKYRAFLTLQNIFGIVLSGVAAYFISAFIPMHGIGLIIKDMMIAMLYFLLLYFFKIVTKEDIGVIRSVLCLKKKE